MIFKLPDYFSNDLRIWNYIPERKLTTSEVEYILKKGYEFAHSWQVHGAPLKSEVIVQNNALLTVVVDNDMAAASGCSIDKSIAFVQALEKELGVSFMNRMKLLYALADDIHIGDHRKLEDVPDYAVVFNHLAADRKDYESEWSLAKESWLAPQLS